MEILKELERHIEQFRGRSTVGLAEMRHMLLEIEDFISSELYSSLSSDERQRVQSARKEFQVRLQRMEAGDEALPEQQNGPDASQPSPVGEVSGTESGQVQSDKVVAKPHNPAAEQQMELAEKLFYSGRYADAIQLFDRVLQLEPNWERARQHRSEAENYLRTGYIPAVALPADAASAFGKAQSASRLGRYADALALLEKAQAVLRELGIQRWQEGQEFAQKLQESIDAENVYDEGLALFQEGKLDEALERVETAARATGMPKFTDKAQDLRRVKDSLRQIHEAINMPTIDPMSASRAKANLDALAVEFGNNPAFTRLQERFRTIVPRVVEPLKEQTRDLKNQAEHAGTLEEALYLAKQARQSLDQIRNLEGVDEGLNRLQIEIDRMLRNLQRYDDDLQGAERAYENNPAWPSQAARMSAEVRQRYPNDPGVSRLKGNLRAYFLRQLAIRIGLVIVGIVILVLAGAWGVGRFKAYQLSLTPTVTPTATATATFTPTFTVTPTFTPTFTPSPTPTLTPTPVSAIAQRDMWARNGCYESFTAIGRIPRGGFVRFLPSERRFDDFNRECTLVEYQGETRSVIGWVLTMDLGASFPSTPSPSP